MWGKALHAALGRWVKAAGGRWACDLRSAMEQLPRWQAGRLARRYVQASCSPPASTGVPLLGRARRLVPPTAPTPPLGELAAPAQQQRSSSRFSG
jgi:hypothetical protein